MVPRALRCSRFVSGFRVFFSPKVSVRPGHRRQWLHDFNGEGVSAGQRRQPKGGALVNRLSPPATSTLSPLWQRAATNRSRICRSATWIQLHRGFALKTIVPRGAAPPPADMSLSPSPQCSGTQHLVAA